ncbi:MAG: hypothetical protein ACREQ5_14590 [Candidatus Dormibacteria bacterium]
MKGAKLMSMQRNTFLRSQTERLKKEIDAGKTAEFLLDFFDIAPVSEQGKALLMYDTKKRLNQRHIIDFRAHKNRGP